ncbi:Uncharacterised protein [Legionella beliardensis]|uniref:Uncharacterized protein n=1 Tax=Legionella beliardensis TaxID=91822 RepID=A0A378I4E3_9GAMM|nr:hypothetical protein [Legionella beliardensis]STX29873.1 Uncharacterised protein [Legionella beliardensis]
MKIKRISAALLCSATVLFAGSSFAQAQERTSNTMLKGYDLPPHQEQVFDGNWFSSRVLQCSIRAEKHEQNPLVIEAKKNRVVVNGVILPEGSMMTVLVNVGDNIEFELDTRAKLGITNGSDNLMNIRCD